MTKTIMTIFLLMIFVTSFTVAQQDNDSIQFEAEIKVISKTVKDTITLRWAPTDPLAWKYSNEYGYKVEKYTLVRDGKLLKTFDKKFLISQPQKPLPSEEWELEAKTNDFAAIAAQSIYGETFEVDHKEEDVYQMINKAEELENRFSFALFCADQSFKVANMSGLSVVDTEIKENERYLYKVYSVVPHEYMAIDTGYIYIDASEFTKLTPPVELNGEFKEKTVLLTWNTLFDQGVYSGYIIERSDDGCKHFFRVNDNAFINTVSEGKGTRDFAFFVDTLPKDQWQHCYRIKGVTPFGDISEPSKIIIGESFIRLEEKPFITSYEIINNSQVSIKWELPKEYNEKIKGFKLLSGSNMMGDYKKIRKEFIPPEKRTYLYEKPEKVNYIIVVAIDENDIEYRSQTVLAQLEDNTPPKPPQNIKGSIDTTGSVTIIWSANDELDVSGYRVFRSNTKNTEFMQITVDAIQDTTFFTETNLKTLNKFVYYRIVAEDFHGNPSDFSEILELERQDIIPPSQPFFTGQTQSDSCIYMEWKNSASEDVIKIFLQRTNTQNNKTVIVATFLTKDSVRNYCDHLAEPGISYEYKLIVEDESGNRSESSKNILGKLIDKGIRDGIKKIKVEIDRKEKQIKLLWEYDNENISGYFIYRSFDEVPLRMYKTISGNSTSFIDANLKLNTTYTYRIRAEYNNGSGSPFSEPVTVEY